MTIDKYALHVGLSNVTIFNLIKSGKLLNACYQDSKGRWIINVEEAQKVTGEQTIARQAAQERKKRERGELEPEDMKKKADNPQSYTDARTGNEYVKLHLAKIELAEKQGSLISKEKAVEESFNFARGIREALMIIPDRVAAEFAAENNERNIHKTLSDELRAALKGATDIIAKHEARFRAAGKIDD